MRRVLLSRGTIAFDADQPGAMTRSFGMIQDITERHDAAQRMAASETDARARLIEIQSIYDSAPVGLSVIGPDMRFVRVNHVVAERNGRSADDHIGRTIREVEPRMASALEDRFRRALAGEDVLHAELTGETAGSPGVDRTLMQSWTPQRDTGGHVIGVNVVSWEVTEQRAAEARARLATDAAELGVWSCDPRTGHVTLDDRCRSIWGMPSGFTPTFEHVIQSALRLDQPRLRRALEAVVDPAGPGMLAVEFRTYSPHLPMRYVAVQGRAVFNGGICVRVSGVLQDVTTRRSSAALLSSSDAHLELVQESLNVGLWDWSPSTGTLNFSPQQCRIYGLGAADMPISYGHWCSMILRSDLPRVLAGHNAGFAATTELRFRIRRPDGEIRRISSRARSIALKDREFLVGVDVDVTED